MPAVGRIQIVAQMAEIIRLNLAKVCLLSAGFRHLTMGLNQWMPTLQNLDPFY